MLRGTTRHPLSDGAVRRLAGVALWAGQLPRIPVWDVNGGGLRIAYAGGKEALEHIKGLFCPSAGHVRTGRIPLWALESWARDKRAQTDLVVCEASRFQSRMLKSARFAVPEWAAHEMAIAAAPEKLLSGRKQPLRTRIRRAERHLGYSFRHSGSLGDFEHFRSAMYVPFVQARHKGLARVTPYEVHRECFRRNGLLVVERNGEPVAATLMYLEGDTAVSVEDGVLGDRLQEFMKEGVYAYLRWAQILWAKDHGAVRFNIGGTRPWRSNGSFSAKRAWGATVVARGRPFPLWYFFFGQGNRRLVRRLNEIGFVAKTPQGLKAVLVDDGSMNETDRKRAVAEAGQDGLEVMTVRL